MAHLLQHTIIHFQICDTGGHIMSKNTKYTIIQNIYDTYEVHIFFIDRNILKTKCYIVNKTVSLGEGT